MFEELMSNATEEKVQEFSEKLKVQKEQGDPLDMIVHMHYSDLIREIQDTRFKLLFGELCVVYACHVDTPSEIWKRVVNDVIKRQRLPLLHEAAKLLFELLIEFSGVFKYQERVTIQHQTMWKDLMLALQNCCQNSNVKSPVFFCSRRNLP